MLKPLLVAVLAAFVTAAPANADQGPAGDDPEDNYLYVLHDSGINPTSDSDAITAGYGLCGQVANGVKGRTLINGVAAASPELSAEQAADVVDTAVAWLCPQYTRQYLATRVMW